MAGIIKASLLLLALKVAANPYPALNDGPTSTVVITETTTLYATLVPPVLPGVTVSANYTSSLFTSVTTQIVNLNCTATAYSAILAPTSVISPASPPVASVSVASVSVASSAAHAARQVTASSSLSLTSAASSANNPNVVTSTVATTITATTTAVQRPPFTRTIYSLVVATQTTPYVRTISECSATQEVAYTIEISTVTSTISRNIWPSTTTKTTFIECTPRPTIPLAPPATIAQAPTVKPTTGAMVERQVAAVISTTIHETRVIYTATTITQTEPSTRVITSCSVSTSAA